MTEAEIIEELELQRVEQVNRDNGYPPYPVAPIVERELGDVVPPVAACEVCGVAIWGHGWCSRCQSDLTESNEGRLA